MTTSVPRTTKAVWNSQVFQMQEDGGTTSAELRAPHVKWEANPVKGAFGEPPLVRGTLVDFDGEPRTDTYPEARFEVDGRWFAPAPIVEGILVAEIDFGYLEGEHVLRLVGAPVVAEVLRVVI